MNLRDFRRAGHTPTLFSAFLYFDVSFMVWILPGALANSIVPEFGLSDSQKGLMVAVPLLGGALLRLVLGLLTDHIGARRTGILGMSLTTLPLLLGWLWADSFGKILLVGLLLGVAGASFAAALPLASRWYPPRYPGAGHGDRRGRQQRHGPGHVLRAAARAWSGAGTPCSAWRLSRCWRRWPCFCVFAKDSPNQPAPRPLADYADVLKMRDTWWFCLFYSITFGGFVGLASFLNVFFLSQYGLSKVQAGNFATLCVLAGSFLRPLGGYLADRFGGVRMLTGALPGRGRDDARHGDAAAAVRRDAPAVRGHGGCSGMGNGAVFQLVPQRFPKEIGVTTGIVGAAGGFGGFVLPNRPGQPEADRPAASAAASSPSRWSAGFGGALALAYASRGWQGIFLGEGGRAAEARSRPAPDPGRGQAVA